MGQLSELVKRDYDDEVEIIRKAGGNLWLTGLAVAFCFAFMWLVDWFFMQPWSRQEIGGAMIGVICFSFIYRAWERYKIATKMRHQREVRMEAKLDALLGIVKIEER